MGVGGSTNHYRSCLHWQHLNKKFIQEALLLPLYILHCSEKRDDMTGSWVVQIQQISDLLSCGLDCSSLPLFFQLIMSNLSNQSAVDLLSSLLSLIQNVNESVLRSSKEVAQRLDKLEEEITQQEEMIRGLIDRFNTNPTTAIGGNTTAQGRWANIRPTYKHPRGGENERYRQFSWGLIDTIGQHVEGSNWDRSITQSFQRNSRSISNLIASNGRKHGNLPSNSTWIDVISVAQTEMARLLEDMSVDLFPLRACEGQWGARLIMTEAFRRTSTDTTPKKQGMNCT